jgi:hypothetical protein
VARHIPRAELGSRFQDCLVARVKHGIIAPHRHSFASKGCMAEGGSRDTLRDDARRLGMGKLRRSLGLRNRSRFVISSEKPKQARRKTIPPESHKGNCSFYSTQRTILPTKPSVLPVIGSTKNPTIWPTSLIPLMVVESTPLGSFTD